MSKLQSLKTSLTPKQRLGLLALVVVVVFGILAATVFHDTSATLFRRLTYTLAVNDTMIEKLEDGNYQIFTMSKADEEGWSNWTLIDDALLNGTRNSVDFEVVVIGNRLNLLIDGKVYYTTDRVPMTESSVK